MKIRRNIAISESGFIFNPSAGDSYSTNPIGTEIIKMLKEDKSLAEISVYVQSTYHVESSTFEKDLYDFVKMLEKFKLTEDEKKA
ncbi:MAG: PqqD family protein [Cytophagales bacterium]|nr:PqqD family protein [Cytophagales bacterium]